MIKFVWLLLVGFHLLQQEGGYKIMIRYWSLQIPPPLLKFVTF